MHNVLEIYGYDPDPFGIDQMDDAELSSRARCLTLEQTSGNSGKCMWLGRKELNKNSLSCLALQHSLQDGNMGLPRMPSNPLRKPNYLCLHNGSTSRNFAAPQTWGPKV